MKRLLITCALGLTFVVGSSAQCTKWVYNSFTKKQDCAQFGTAGTGDVTGPASTTAGTIPKMDATGKILSASSVVEDADSVNITGKNLEIGPTVLDATAGFLARVTVWTTGDCLPVSTGFTYNNSAGAMGCTLPAITAANVGLQMCFENDSTRTGAITLTMPASTTVSIDGTAGSSAGTLVSGGAAGDRACVVAKATGKYMGYVGSGSWVNN